MNPIPLGMPTLMETDSIEECAALCGQLGLDFIELNMNLPQYQADALDARRLGALMRREDVFFTIHLDENTNVCDFNSEVAEAYVRTTLSAIGTARALGMPILNLHLSQGVYFTLPGEKVYLFDRYRDAYFARLATFRDACEQAVGGSGIRICVENCDGFHAFTREGIEFLLQSEVFGLTFDVGHSHSNGDADEPFILRHADRLLHMHLHDGRGRQNHLPLGEGEIDIAGRWQLALRRRCSAVLETKTVAGLTQSVGFLRKMMG